MNYFILVCPLTGELTLAELLNCEQAESLARSPFAKQAAALIERN
jgi:hypothetical protein